MPSCPGGNGTLYCTIPVGGETFTVEAGQEKGEELTVGVESEFLTAGYTVNRAVTTAVGDSESVSWPS